MRWPTAIPYPAARLAGLVAWAAVGLELWSGPVVPTALAASLPISAWAKGLHAVFGVMAVAALVLRDQRALRVILAWVMAGIALALTALYRYNSSAALLIIPMIELASLLGPAALAVSFLAANGGLLAVVFLQRQMDAPLAYVGLHASLQLFAVLLVRAMQKEERARESLAAAHAELMAARGVLAEVTREQERLRLSRELHDVAGHKLTALRLNLAAVIHNKQLDTAPVLALCQRLTEELLDDLRAVAHQLRLHDGLDIGATLLRMAAPFPRPKVTLDIGASARVNTVEQAEALLRAFQEGLTNAARHADASALWASLQREGDTVVLDMRDNGRVNVIMHAGRGLTGMRERMHALGGDVAFGRHHDGGFHLRAWLPL